jgi:hypothetical protein
MSAPRANGATAAAQSRRVVASYTGYAEAERAVDRLSDSGFPVEHVAIVGWLFFAIDWVSPIVARGWLILDGLWVGTLAGVLFGVLAYAITGGARDFTSIPSMRAKRYDLLVDEAFAPEAERLLTGGAGAPGEAPTAPAPAAT